MIQKYKQKKVGIIGLSNEGQDSIKFFLKQEAFVYACDRRTKAQLGDLYSQLPQDKIQLRLGNNYLDDLADYDVIVRTPGAALFLPELILAKKRGQEITSLTKLFFDFCRAKIIGVTGTKGKGTTTTLIGEILKVSGYKVYVGGNIGTPLLSVVEQIKKDDLVVLEMSSFQLEDLHKSPHISVILNITSEHLLNQDPLATNYHYTTERYIQAKTNIVKYQQKEDYCIVNSDYKNSKNFAKFSPAKIYEFSKNHQVKGAYVEDEQIILDVEKTKKVVAQTSKLQLRGKHNWENILAAILGAYCAGGKISAIRKIIPKFKGLEHRLEFVKEVKGIKYYNDSFSTIPDTTIAAITSFSEPVILIAGGSDKGSDFTNLGRAIIKNNIKCLILIGRMADKIEQAVKQAAHDLSQPLLFSIVRDVHNMPEIIQKSQEYGQRGDVVLLSPACASFDMFKNYKDRGNQFKTYVRQIL